MSYKNSYKITKKGSEGKMNWYWLLMLVCPIMMIWMMKGMHGDHKAGNSNNSHSLEQVTNELNELKERNNELHRQVENLQQKQHV